MDENYDVYSDLMPNSSDQLESENDGSGEEMSSNKEIKNKRRTNKLPARKRKAPKAYSPEPHSPKPRRNNKRKIVDSTVDLNDPLNIYEFESHLMLTKPTVTLITKNQEDLRKKLKILGKEPTPLQLKNACRLDEIDMCKAARAQLGVMSTIIETPVIDDDDDNENGEVDLSAVNGNNADRDMLPDDGVLDNNVNRHPFSDNDEPVFVDDEEHLQPSTSRRLTVLQAPPVIVDDEEYRRQSSTTRIAVRQPPVVHITNEDEICKKIVDELVPRLTNSIINSDSMCEQIAAKILPHMKNAMENISTRLLGRELSGSGGFLVGDSIEFGLPVSGRRAAKSLDLLLLRNPQKLKVFVSMICR